MAVKLTFYGSMALLIERSDGYKILIDPYLTDNPQTDAQPQQFYDVDLILLTHAAYDHFGDTVDIMAHSQARLMCGYDCKGMVQEQLNLPKDRFINALYGDEEHFGMTTVRCVPAFHHSTRTFDGVRVYAPPFGYVVEIEPGAVLYHTGDTCLSAEMELIGRIYQPDILCVAISRVAMVHGCVMTPREAAFAAHYTGAKLAIPGHYPPEQQAQLLDEFRTHMRTLAPHCTVLDARNRTIVYEPARAAYEQ